MGKGVDDDTGCGRGAISLAEASGQDAAGFVAPENLAEELPYYKGDDDYERKAEAIEQRTRELADQVAEYAATDEGWRDWLSFTAKLHLASPTNELWKYVQLAVANRDNPDFDATSGITTSPTRWAALGRKIKPEYFPRKGGLPPEDPRYCVQQFMPRRFLSVLVDDKTKQPGPDGKYPKKKIRIADPSAGFKAYLAFHEHATEGDPLPEDPWKHCTGSDDDAQLLLDHLQTACDAWGVTVEYTDDPRRLHGARGFYRAKDKRIVIDSRLPRADQAGTFLHEAIHHVAGDRGYDDRKDQQMKEIATQSAVHVIGSRYGLQDEAATFPYLASWSKGDPEKIRELSSEIHSRCRKFFEHVDPVLQKLATGEAAQRAERKKSGTKRSSRSKARAKKTVAAS